MTSNFCEACNKTFSTGKIFKKHLQTKGHHIRIAPEDHTIFKCICLKSFTKLPALSRHRKTCVVVNKTVGALEYGNNQISNPPEDVIQSLQERLERKDQENQEIRERLERKDQEMDALRKQVESLMEKSTGNTTYRNSNNNNTHIENQNVFIVNNFGNENTDYLTDKRVNNLIKNNAPFACIPQLIQSIHFNPEHPENHNIQVTNMKSKFAKIFKHDKWITTMKHRTIDDLIETICVLLEEKYEENKDSLSDFRQERFRDFQDKYETQDKDMIKNIKDEVDVTLLNGTKDIYKK